MIFSLPTDFNLKIIQIKEKPRFLKKRGKKLTSSSHALGVTEDKKNDRSGKNCRHGHPVRQQKKLLPANSALDGALRRPATKNQTGDGANPHRQSPQPLGTGGRKRPPEPEIQVHQETGEPEDHCAKNRGGGDKNRRHTKENPPIEHITPSFLPALITLCELFTTCFVVVFKQIYFIL